MSRTSVTFAEAYREMTGRESQTTFWMDFSIADRFGANAIVDTYERSRYWVSNVDYWAELTFVLNWRCWQHYEMGRQNLSQIYADLYHRAMDEFYDKWPSDSEEAQLFFQMTD